MRRPLTYANVVATLTLLLISTLLVVVSTALAVSAPTAQAHTRVHHKPHPGIPAIFNIALQDGVEYWNRPVPCDGKIAFAPGHYEAEAGMWSEWNDEVEGQNWQNYEGPQVSATNFTDCTIHYNPSLFPNERTMLEDWPEFATNVAHEVEHFDNLYWLETSIDNGTLSEEDVSACAVNYPEYTGLNMPASAKHHAPAGANTVATANIHFEVDGKQLAPCATPHPVW